MRTFERGSESRRAEMRTHGQHVVRRDPRFGVFSARHCRAVAVQMTPCFQPFESFTIVSCVVLGASWVQAVEGLVRIVLRADPLCEEEVADLLLVFDNYCRQADRTCTPAAFGGRSALCRRMIESVAARMSSCLGDLFTSFESSNSFLVFPVRSASVLDGVPFGAGIAKVDCREVGGEDRATSQFEGTRPPLARELLLSGRSRSSCD